MRVHINKIATATFTLKILRAHLSHCCLTPYKTLPKYPVKDVFQLTVAWLTDALMVPAVPGDKDQFKVMPCTIAGTEY